jgi:3-hydroxybutyryl-CoA dehydrogenase
MTDIAVIGLGTMGLGIAEVFAAAGFSVLATDEIAEVRAAAPARLADALAARVRTGRIDAGRADATRDRIRVVERLDDLGPARLAIEAIIETLAAKRALVVRLEQVLDDGAVIATNTSSLRVGDIAAGAAHPGRILGLHFFNPAPAMRLVELIAHAETTPTPLRIARELTEKAGKTVIAAPDRPGFVVNRCARPFYGEALAVAEAGRAPAEIDAALVAHGYRMGPFTLIDLIGADVHLAATEGMWSALDRHPRYRVFDRLRAQVASGHLGRKSGRGFVHPDALPAAPADSAEIVARIEATLVNEAAWCLAEGSVTEADIDTGLTLGLNFPRGPFAILLAEGRQAIGDRLAELERRTPFAGRYQPAPRLQGDP